MFYKKGSKLPQNSQSEIELTALPPPVHADLLLSIIMQHQESILPILLVNAARFVNPSDDFKKLLESITMTQDAMLKKLLTNNIAALNKNPESQNVLEKHWLQNEKSYLTQQSIGHLTYGKSF